MGAHFEALDEGVLLVPFDSRFTQVGFNVISVEVCLTNIMATNCMGLFPELNALFQSPYSC